MTTDEFNAGVLRRMASLERFQEETNRRLSMVETKNAVDEVHRVNVEKRLANIESALSWLIKLVGGALILAIVAFLVQGGFAK